MYSVIYHGQSVTRKGVSGVKNATKPWWRVGWMIPRVMNGRHLNRRIHSIDVLRAEVAAWRESRDRFHAKVAWQFITGDASIDLKRIYPALSGAWGMAARWFILGADSEGSGRPGRVGQVTDFIQGP